MLVIGVARRGWPLTLNHEMQILSLAIVTAVIATFCYLRERRQRELAQVRSVSEAAQRVMLRPLPSRLGPLKVASVYLAAEAEAQIGGDLFAAARAGEGTRMIIGDVRGKGLSSISDCWQPGRGTLPDKAWAQRYPSHRPHRAGQFRCHPIM